MSVVEERVFVLEGKMEHMGITLARMESTLSSLNQKVETLDLRADSRADKLDERLQKQFLWIVGIQMTTLIALVAGLFGIVAKLI